ncbi:MAG: endonuclease [Solirubrobacteraceae bacterium]|nr:endonuclease [Solirubrobacteraceae bacterium]
MPEGDTIHYAANRIRPVLEGRVPERILTPSPRSGGQRWPERLEGRRVRTVDAYGKHLFLRFDGGLTIHSHLRMTGSWAVYRVGQAWRRAARRAWLVLEAGFHQVVQFDGPVLELVTDSRTRFDQRLAGLGPDVIGPEFDEQRFLARLREDDPTRPIGDALLDQRTLAGIGNLWKAEACFEAAIDPWRAVGATSDEEARAIVGVARERMARSARDGHMTRPRAVYGRRGEACRRCGATIRAAGQGEENRITYWCPGCQA